MSALDDLRNKRGIYTHAEACVLLAGESTIANEAAEELARLRAERDAYRKALEEIALKNWCDNDGRGCNNESIAAAALAAADGEEG